MTLRTSSSSSPAANGDAAAGAAGGGAAGSGGSRGRSSSRGGGEGGGGRVAAAFPRRARSETLDEEDLPALISNGTGDDLMDPSDLPITVGPNDQVD